MNKKIKKHFTPSEANKRLPYIRKIVGEILEKGQSFQLERIKNENGEATPESSALYSEIECLTLELEDLGCFFKDWNFEIGLVDFPAKINGQEVFLCWRSDEEQVKFFHPANEGFSSRQPIPEIYLNTLN